MKKPILIMIAGGTSSGKSTTAKKIEKNFEKKVVNLCAENYVRRESIHLTADSSWQEHLNHHFKFNNSDRLEKTRLLENLNGLLNWEKTTIKVRQKDSTGISRWVDQEIEPSKIIVLEGINALQDEEIRSMADLKIYVEADKNVRLMRKIFRSPWCRKALKEETNTKELRDYGESLLKALFFWQKGTGLSEKEHVITTRKYADLVICSNNWLKFKKEIEKIFGYIELLFESNRKKLKEQLPELALLKENKEGVYQELDNTIVRLTKKIENLTSEKEIEALENSEVEIEELKILKKLLEKIQGEEEMEVKIEVMNK